MDINVARKLHERRHRASPVMTTGELLNMIGSDGLQEALNNRWLVADMDSGFLMLNTGGGKLKELEEACRCHCGKLDCACAASVEAPLVSTMPMREAFAGFGLPRPSGGVSGAAAPEAIPRPLPATPTSAAEKTVPQIGDDAMVTDEGKTFTGKVAAVGHDGRYRLSFGSEKPSMNRDYGSNELRLLTKADAHA